jgi:poly-gamma-glutamate synthesis protein (capsule biosynthesis protein)
LKSFKENYFGKVFEVAFIGDIMLGRKVEYKLFQHNSYRSNFREIKAFLDTVNFRCGNLECPITITGNMDKSKKIHLKAHPRAIETLKFLNFNYLSLANNHMLDFGLEGLSETIATLRENGILFSGASDESDASLSYNPALISNQIAVFSAAGKKFNLNSKHIAILEEPILIEKIREFKNLGMFVCLYAHTGVEYDNESTNEIKTLFRKLADNGVDLVVGGHPHVIQPMENYGEKLIKYSLGNFIFDQDWDLSKNTQNGEILITGFHENRLIEFEQIPILIDSTYAPILKPPFYK